MEAVTYEQLISDVAKGVEGVGAAIMVLGGLLSLGKYALSMLQPGDPRERYRRLRRRLGQAILLGLEVLIVGDIVRTIIVDPTVKSVGVLGMIVAIRIVLSFSLEVEIDGVWPWNLWRLEGRQGGENGDHPPERLS
jgi:uncharacterized membrane protein